MRTVRRPPPVPTSRDAPVVSSRLSSRASIPPPVPASARLPPPLPSPTLAPGSSPSSSPISSGSYAEPKQPLPHFALPPPCVAEQQRARCDCTGDRLRVLAALLAALVVTAAILGGLAGAGILSPEQSGDAAAAASDLSVPPANQTATGGQTAIGGAGGQSLTSAAALSSSVLQSAASAAAVPPSSASAGHTAASASSAAHAAASAAATSSPSASSVSAASTVPQLTATFDSPLVCPAPLLQSSVLGGLGSLCWFNEWMTLMAARLQPTLMGTPRMTGNWSAHVAQAATWDGCAAPTIYPSSAYPSFKPAQELQDRVGGLLSVLVHVDGAAGSDTTGSGSASSPFASLQRALTLTRSLPATVTKSVVFQSGLYYFSETVMLGGTEDSNLILMASPGQDVVFVGGVPVTPSWSQVKENVFVTRLPASLNMSWAALNEVFAGPTRLTRARWPNGDPFSPLLGSSWAYGPFRGNGTLQPPADILIPYSQTVMGSVRPGTYFSSFEMSHGGLNSIYSPQQSYWYDSLPGGIVITDSASFSPNFANWVNVSSSYWHMIQARGWGGWSFRIADIDVAQAAFTFLEGGWQEGRRCTDGGEELSCTPVEPGYVDHQFAELDTSNEYYIDAESGLLYLWCNDTLPAALEVSQVPTMLWIQNSSNITIQGITVQHSSNAFMSPFESFGGGDWTGTHEAAIRISGCQNCSVANCLLTELGGNAVVVDRDSNGTFIGYNEISFIGGNGVSVIGTMIGYNASWEPTQPRDTRVQSNLITNVGAYVKQSGAVFVAVSYATTVDGNVCMIGPRTGINFNDGFAGAKVMSNNVLLSWGMQTTDVGPFNVWNRNAYFAFNNDLQEPSWFSSWSFVHDNLINVDYNSLALPAAALDYDDGSDRYFTYHNVLMSSVYKAQYSLLMRFEDNLLFPEMGAECQAPFNGDLLPVSTFLNITCVNLALANGSVYGAGVPSTTPSLPGLPSMSNNSYGLLPQLGTAGSPVWGVVNDQLVSLSQLQALSLTYPAVSNVTEQGSRLVSLPTNYPYYRFWGSDFLNLSSPLCPIYDPQFTQPLPSTVRELAALQPNSSFVDPFNLTWTPSVSCLLTQWPPSPTPVVNAPNSTNFLYSVMAYSSYCAFNLQNGLYDLTWLVADYSYGRSPFNVTVNGQLWLQNVQVAVVAHGYNCYLTEVLQGVAVTQQLLVVEFIGLGNGVFCGFQIQPAGSVSQYPAGHG